MNTERKDVKEFLNAYFPGMSLGMFSSMIGMSDKSVRRYMKGEELAEYTIRKLERIMEDVEKEGYVYHKWEAFRWFGMFKEHTPFEGRLIELRGMSPEVQMRIRHKK